MKVKISILFLLCLTMVNCQKIRKPEEKFIETADIIGSPPPIEELSALTIQIKPENTDTDTDTDTDMDREIFGLFLEFIEVING